MSFTSVLGSKVSTSWPWGILVYMPLATSVRALSIRHMPFGISSLAASLGDLAYNFGGIQHQSWHNISPLSIPALS